MIDNQYWLSHTIERTSRSVGHAHQHGLLKKSVSIALCLLIIPCLVRGISYQDPRKAPFNLGHQNLGNIIDLKARAPKQQINQYCPDSPSPHIVEIREANPQIDKHHHDEMRQLLINSVKIPNTTIRLGPNVVLDFTSAADDDIPLRFGPCVRLISVATFGPDTSSPFQNTNLSGRMEESARTPHSLGPLLKFGPHRSDEDKVFILIECPEKQMPTSDNDRISGFRLYGPSFGQQSDGDTGIRVFRCLNVEISNMEIAGWGNAGIDVQDEGNEYQQPADGPGQEQPNNAPGERIGRPEQIRILHNYIHNNQHPRQWIVSCRWIIFCTPWLSSHTAGYGVDVSHGAWAQIDENVFDFNRHAITASGDSGGYGAFRNLVLKGGGVHVETPTIHTQQFDVHGSGDNGFGDPASVRFRYYQNSFQYYANSFSFLHAPAVEIRGRPQMLSYIHYNVFAHEDLLGGAINVNDMSDLDVIKIANNISHFDSYGHYGVCDFDDDGIDDLFLATGETWWYSSSGEFQWTYLSQHTERLDQVKLGYFDDDSRCDVLTQRGADWVVSSGGTDEWKSIGQFSAPLSEVTFGQFDPNIRDHRPGVTRHTTHAFWRTPNGEWLVTPLAGGPTWQNTQSSSFPLSKLRFGDFTGDGVTDVLAVESGHWAISDAARSPWQQLNPDLSDDVSSLYIADLDNNNIDDLIKLEVVPIFGSWTNPFDNKIAYIWSVSYDGRSPWHGLRAYNIPEYPLVPSVFTFVGRFGSAPGGDLLFIDQTRIGQFFSPAEDGPDASPDWKSRFPY